MRWKRVFLAFALVAGIVVPTVGGSSVGAGARSPTPPTVSNDETGLQAIDIAGSGQFRLAVVLDSDSTVWANRIDCSSGAWCGGWGWQYVGWGVTELRVAEINPNVLLLVGRGIDGVIYYSVANCPDGQPCSFSPYASTGGFGWDIQLAPSASNGCVSLAVIGNDWGVWKTDVCTNGVRGWVGLGGGVGDIEYNGVEVYGVGPSGDLWRKAPATPSGAWTGLGGYVRQPVSLLSQPVWWGTEFMVAAVGADNAIWVYQRLYKDFGVWLRPFQPYPAVFDFRRASWNSDAVAVTRSNGDAEYCFYAHTPYYEMWCTYLGTVPSTPLPQGLAGQNPWPWVAITNGLPAANAGAGWYGL